MTVLRTREEIVEYVRSVGHPDPRFDWKGKRYGRG